MSDSFKDYDKLKFRDAVEFGTQAPNLKADFCDQDCTVLTLDIKYSFLRELFKSKISFPKLTYTEILNSQLQVLQLVQCERLEDRLYRISSAIAQLYSKNSGGHQKAKLDAKIKKLAVFGREVVSSCELVDSLAKFEYENVSLTERCRQLHEKFTQSNEAKEHAEEKLSSVEKNLEIKKEELQKLEKKLQSAEQDLSNVQDFYKTIWPPEFKSIQSYENPGKPLDEVCSSQRSRKLNALKTNVTNALWFSESYGLEPTSVTFHDSQGGSFDLNLCNKNKDLEKMKEVLFIMDRFKISDQAYHEIATISNTLPKLHSIVNIRDSMNNNLEIHRTPGNTPGAYVSLRTELQKMLEKQPEPPAKLKIKISGDGTKVSRISNYVVISFSVLDDSVKLSSNEQNVLAIVKTAEKYDCLATCLLPVFREINELSSCGEIEIEEKKVKIEFFFGGDMKFLQICLGLGSSTGEFACPWCKVSKQDRGDTTKEWDFFHSDEMKRTIREIRDLSESSKKQYGVKFKPLISIEPCRIIPDELHLLMRIFDVMLRNLIDDAVDKDAKEEAKKGKSTKENINELVEKIRSCGVTFSIWLSKAGEMDWSALTGNDVKKVLRNLPDKLFFVVHNETHDATVKLWKDFSNLYNFICSDLSETKDVNHIFTKCKQWVDHFLSLGEKRKGYAQKNVTPYIHCLLYHVPFFIKNYGSLRQFSGQPTEKINDDIKSIHHLKTNRYDCAMDALKVRKRIETNNESGREKRSYSKTKSEYWQDEIRFIRSRKKQIINEEIREADSVNTKQQSEYEYQTDTENLSVSEIKKILKDHGINTKVRKHDKLIQLLKETMLKNKL